MRFFFHSKKFKIISLIIAILLVIGVTFGVLTSQTAPQTNLVGAIIKPVQGFISSISESVGDFLNNFESSKKTKEKNKDLQNQIGKLNKNLIEHENLERENKFLKEFIGIKEKNPDFEMQSAMVIARDGNDPYKTFTIDKGILDDISLHDPVITSNGLVGYIYEVSSTQSVVMTVLNPAINITSIDNRTRDIGNICGKSDIASKGYTKLSYLPRDNAVASGDFIVSSGDGGIFPKGQIIGTVKEVKQEPNDINSYAIIKPIVDISNISDVMIIKSFSGQGGIAK